MYVLKGIISVEWVGDGAGPMSVPSAQVLTVGNDFGANGGFVTVPGGDAPSTANISTACSTLATNLAGALNASISQIQGFASGGG